MPDEAHPERQKAGQQQRSGYTILLITPYGFIELQFIYFTF